MMEARERERVVAYGADAVLGLPGTSALDARTRVKSINDAPTEQVVRDRGRRKRDDSWFRPISSLRVSRRCLAERSWNRGPAGRKCAAGVIERSNCNASGSTYTR